MTMTIKPPPGPAAWPAAAAGVLLGDLAAPGVRRSLDAMHRAAGGAR
jgi:hypothetical protein